MRLLLAGLAGVIGILTTGPATVLGSLPWGPQERLTTAGTTSETGLNHGALTVDSQGQVTAAWAEQDGPNNNFRIHTRKRNGNGIWDSPTLAVDFHSTYAGIGLGAKFPALVTLPGDTLLMVWHDYRIDGINNLELFTKTRPPGMAWGDSLSELRLTTTNHPESIGDNSYLPNLTLDPLGIAHVAWHDFRYDGNNGEILFKSRTGGVWDVTPGDTPDQNVSANSGDSNFPALEAAPDGSLHLLWRDNTNGAFQILYRTRPSGGSWSSPLTLSPPGVAADGAALAVAPDGTVLAAWADARTGTKAVYVRERSPGGAWGPPRRASPEAGGEEPDIAVDAAGHRYLVWQDARVSTFNREIFFQSTAPGGVWDSTGALDTQLSTASGKSSRPTLLVDTAFRVFVLWQDARHGAPEIYFRGATPPSTSAQDISFPATPHAWPNPFRGALHVDNLSPEVRIFHVADVTGRRIATVPVENRRGMWNGHDDNGKAVVPGIYFLLGEERHPAGRVLSPLGKVVRIQ